MSAFTRYEKRLLAEWEAKIGPDATRIRWFQVRVQLWSWLLGGLGIIALVVSAHPHGAVQSALTWFFAAACSLAAFGFALAFYELRKWKNMSRQWRQSDPHHRQDRVVRAAAGSPQCERR